MRKFTFQVELRKKAEKLAEATQQKFGVKTKTYDQADEAMEAADIIVTATNASEPVYSHTLHPGVHLNAVVLSNQICKITIRVYDDR